MTEYANIRFPRADIIATDHVTFSNKMQNVTLPYGSPLTYASSSWYRDTYTDYNHFFVKGVYGTQQGCWYHIGPYWGDTGIGVDNNPDSANLGRIQLKLTAGTNVTITDDATTGSKVISATASGEAGLSPTFNDNITGTVNTLHSLTSDTTQTLAINFATEREYHIVDCTALALSELGSTVSLSVSYPDTSVSEGYILFKNIPGEAHGLTVNIVATTSNSTTISNVVKPNVIAFKNGFIELCCKQIAPTSNISDLHAVYTYITHQTS